MPIKIPTYQRKPYDSVQRAWYVIGGRRMFFKSKMEANFALYLDYLKTQKKILEWEYEPETFVFEKILFGTRSYKPDFRVMELNGSLTRYETKGYFDKKSRTKLKRMKIYYPAIKIVLVDKTQYAALAKWKKLLKWY